MGTFRFSGVWTAASTLLVFHLFAIGLIFFAVDSVREAALTMRSMAFAWSGQAPINAGAVFLLAVFAAPVVAVDRLVKSTDVDWPHFRWSPFPRAVLYYSLFYLIVHYGVFVAKQYYYFRF